MQRNVKFLLISILAVLIFSGCGAVQTTYTDSDTTSVDITTESTSVATETVTNNESSSDVIDIASPSVTNSGEEQPAVSGNYAASVSVPEYSGNASVVINGNAPFFTTDEIASGTESFISLSDLDSLGRCGTAMASVSKDTMPTEERGQIGSVKPTGWHTVKYAGIDGNYLYNRCHLLMYALTGLNAEPKNLITGTRYLNIEGNLPYEKKVVNYIEATGNHVLYRVTPVFEGDNLLCSGEIMEAYSVEDNGAFQFCVYCYNVQPGIEIDYATGNSSGPEFTGSDSSVGSSGEITTSVMVSDSDETYILNTSTKKFHKESCTSVAKIANKNGIPYLRNRQKKHLGTKIF